MQSVYLYGGITPGKPRAEELGKSSNLSGFYAYFKRFYCYFSLFDVVLGHYTLLTPYFFLGTRANT